MNCELRITLKSDMCSASGDGFSLSIDTDVSYDSHGLPVIPSRRIKGLYAGVRKVHRRTEYRRDIRRFRHQPRLAENRERSSGGLCFPLHGG